MWAPRVSNPSSRRIAALITRSWTHHIFLIPSLHFVNNLAGHRRAGLFFAREDIMRTQTAVATTIAFAPETSFGEIGAGPGQLIRRVSSSLNIQKDGFASNEVLPNYQIASCFRPAPEWKLPACAFIMQHYQR